MSNSLQPTYAINLSPARAVRGASRAIALDQLSGEVRATRANTTTDLALHKMENYTIATAAAMNSVVRVAQAQRHLELLAPEASARLAYLADDHVLAMGEMLSDLRRTLRGV